MRAALRAAYIETTQRQAGAQFHAQPAVDGVGLRFVHSPQQWQARLDASGLVLQQASGAWRLTMALQPPVCGAGMERPQPQPSRNEASYARGAVKEWYLNGPLGLEQGFTVTENPCPGEPLRIDVALGGDLKAQTTAGGLVLRDASGKTALRYTDLYAKDATGRRMKSQLQLDEGGHLISLFVNEEGGKYPITIDPLMWTETQRIGASDPLTYDFFGNAFSTDGDLVAIGAYSADSNGENDAGAVYIFKLEGTSWIEKQKLVPPVGSKDGQFGSSVVLIGDTLLVGNPFSNVNGVPGRVFVYALEGETWTQRQILKAEDATDRDGFGLRMAMHDNTLFVTAPIGTVDTLQFAGAVYRFQRNAEGFTQAQKIVSSPPSRLEIFGNSVSFDGQTMVTGANGWVDNYGSVNGSAQIFVASGSDFVLQQKLTDGIPLSDDSFGSDVAVEGDTMVIAARDATVNEAQGAGKAYVFTRSGTVWTEIQQLIPDVVVEGTACGANVSISGDLIALGCQLTNVDGKKFAGATQIFRRSAGRWGENKQLVASDPMEQARFGTPVLLSGTRLFVGAPTYTIGDAMFAGVVYVLETVQNTGAPCAVNDECSSGYCVDGVCCNEACGGNTQSDCQACAAVTGASADGACTMLPAAMNYTCRKVAGQCDVAEVCDGTSSACPMDAKVTTGTQCRGATGICDMVDTCDGINDGCFDQKKRGTVCRTAGGPCDIAEVCDGVMNTCPLEDKVQGANFQCKAAGVSPICDPADFCDGRTKLCPLKFGAVNLSCGQGKTCSGSGVCR